MRSNRDTSMNNETTRSNRDTSNNNNTSPRPGFSTLLSGMGYTQLRNASPVRFKMNSARNPIGRSKASSNPLYRSSSSDSEDTRSTSRHDKSRSSDNSIHQIQPIVNMRFPDMSRPPPDVLRPPPDVLRPPPDVLRPPPCLGMMNASVSSMGLYDDIEECRNSDLLDLSFRSSSAMSLIPPPAPPAMLLANDDESSYEDDDSQRLVINTQAGIYDPGNPNDSDEGQMPLKANSNWQNHGPYLPLSEPPQFNFQFNLSSSEDEENERDAPVGYSSTSMNIAQKISCVSSHNLIDIPIPDNIPIPPVPLPVPPVNDEGTDHSDDDVIIISSPKEAVISVAHTDEVTSPLRNNENISSSPNRCRKSRSSSKSSNSSGEKIPVVAIFRRSSSSSSDSSSSSSSSSENSYENDDRFRLRQNERVKQLKSISLVESESSDDGHIGSKKPYHKEGAYCDKVATQESNDPGCDVNSSKSNNPINASVEKDAPNENENKSRSASPVKPDSTADNVTAIQSDEVADAIANEDSEETELTAIDETAIEAHLHSSLPENDSSCQSSDESVSGVATCEVHKCDSTVDKDLCDQHDINNCRQSPVITDNVEENQTLGTENDAISDDNHPQEEGSEKVDSPDGLYPISDTEYNEDSDKEKREKSRSVDASNDKSVKSTKNKKKKKERKKSSERDKSKKNKRRKESSKKDRKKKRSSPLADKDDSEKEDNSKERSDQKQRKRRNEPGRAVKRKELDRYDVRRVINEKPRPQKKDEFGRDVMSASKSKSRSASRGLSQPKDNHHRLSPGRGRSPASRVRSPASRGRSPAPRGRLPAPRGRSPSLQRNSFRRRRGSSNIRAKSPVRQRRSISPKRRERGRALRSPSLRGRSPLRRSLSFRRKSPVRMRPSPVRRSPIRRLPVRRSPIRRSPVRRSPVRRSPIRRSPVRHSPIRFRRSPRRSPVRFARRSITPIHMRAPRRVSRERRSPEPAVIRIRSPNRRRRQRNASIELDSRHEYRNDSRPYRGQRSPFSYEGASPIVLHSPYGSHDRLTELENPMRSSYARSWKSPSFASSVSQEIISLPYAYSPQRITMSPVSVVDEQNNNALLGVTRKRKKRVKNKKSKKKKKRDSDTPLVLANDANKEIYASGSNILVSVNFSKHSRDAERNKRKVTNATNDPVTDSVVGNLVKNASKKRRKRRKNKNRDLENAKPVAVIDLNTSPFRETTMTEVISLTDSDDESRKDPPTQENRNATSRRVSEGLENNAPGAVANYNKRNPDSTIRFTFSNSQQTRTLDVNSLFENDEPGMEGENATNAANTDYSKTSNTYDPFEPTKSRSPSVERDFMATLKSKNVEDIFASSDRSESGELARNAANSVASVDLPISLDSIMSDGDCGGDAHSPDISHSPPTNSYDHISLDDSSRILRTIDSALQTTLVPQLAVTPTKQSAAPIKMVTPLKQTTSKIAETSAFTSRTLSHMIPSSSVFSSSPLNSQNKANAFEPTATKDVFTELFNNSPKSPASSEGDDIFEPPPVDNSMSPSPKHSTSISKIRSLPLPLPPMDKLSYKTKVATLFDISSRKSKEKPIAAVKGKHTNRGSLRLNKTSATMTNSEREQQLLEETPTSAVDLASKEKWVSKLAKMDIVACEVKFHLKPFFTTGVITKQEYKEIMKKAVPKVCHSSKSKGLNKQKVQALVKAYIDKMIKSRGAVAKKSSSTARPIPYNPKPARTLWG